MDINNREIDYNITKDNEADVDYTTKNLQSAQKIKKRTDPRVINGCLALVCTSNTWKRLFSTAKHIISVLRKSIHPTSYAVVSKAIRQLWPDTSIFQLILWMNMVMLNGSGCTLVLAATHKQLS